MSNRRGPPAHQNKYPWKPNAGHKINETEVGGRLRPYSEITGVCLRCKEQIDWKRRYGKYKPLTEPAKCQRCSKRAVRQAYHNLCSGCAKEQGVCAKCRSRVDSVVGRDSSEVEAEQKMLEEAIKNARERDRRTLLRTVLDFKLALQQNQIVALELHLVKMSLLSECTCHLFIIPCFSQMNKGKSNSLGKTVTKENKVGELFPSSTLEEYAKSSRDNENDDDIDSEDDEDEDEEGEEKEVEEENRVASG